ncbi:MAG: flagellar basal body rod protein FlgC [Planctomycetota bacterium]
MFGALDISTSALVAQRTRMNAISANIAGQNAITDEKGNYAPFQRRVAVFAQGDGRGGEGVHVRQILKENAFKAKYDPSSPFRDERGYVWVPDIDSTVEQINALEASRAYEANITAAEATKSMMRNSLRLLA